jgi:hypothetical protein
MPMMNRITDVQAGPNKDKAENSASYYWVPQVTRGHISLDPTTFGQ